MINKKIYLILFLLLSFAFSINKSYCIGLQEIEALENKNESNSYKEEFDNEHWVHKTLENISVKSKESTGYPNKKLLNNQAINRDEAALILINLIGRIEEGKIQLTDVEKAELNILRQELKTELKAIVTRINTMEGSIDTLKASVTKLETENSKSWKHELGNDFKINGAMQVRYTGNLEKGADNEASNFSIPVNEIVFLGKLYKNLNFYTSLIPSRQFSAQSASLILDAFISSDIIPNHKISLGEQRVPIGYEGTLSPYLLDTITKSQISRKYADTRDTGIKINGNWKYLSYYAGVFNGSLFSAKDTNDTLDFASWAIFKPLSNYQKFGNLELGGGYACGKTALNHYNKVGFYSGYKYKKINIRGEYAFMDGYKAPTETVLTPANKSNGWYINGSYDFTKKLTFISRFDQFDPNDNIMKNSINEYTIGINYFIDKPNLKLQLNLINVDNQNGKNSNRIVAQTQYNF